MSYCRSWCLGARTAKCAKPQTCDDIDGFRAALPNSGDKGDIVTWNVCEAELWAVLSQVKVLGTGSYGSVYQVRSRLNPDLPDFALKVFSLRKPSHVNVTLWEALAGGMILAMSRVASPPPVPVFCRTIQTFVCGSPPTRVCTAMELGHGSLKALFKSDACTPDVAASALIQVLMQLVAIALSFQAVHGDLYTRNVLYVKFDTPRDLCYDLFGTKIKLRAAFGFTLADFGFVTSDTVLKRPHDSLKRGDLNRDDFYAALGATKKQKSLHILHYAGAPVYARDVLALLSGCPRRYSIVRRALNLCRDAPLNTPHDFVRLVQDCCQEAITDSETSCVTALHHTEPAEFVPRDVLALCSASTQEIARAMDCSLEDDCVPRTSGPV